VRRSVQEVVSLEDDVKLRPTTPVITELSNKNSTLTHARGPSRPATMHARVFVEAEREAELEISHFASTSTVTDSTLAHHFLLEIAPAFLSRIFR
jgi:hypothetical protein